MVKSIGVKVTSFTINPNESIIIEMGGQGGEVELTLPNDMISEIHTIRSGGEEITFQKASNATATTVKFDLLSNTDSIEIIGKAVVPEFPAISGLVLALSLLAIIGLVALVRGKGIKATA